MGIKFRTTMMAGTIIGVMVERMSDNTWLDFKSNVFMAIPVNRWMELDGKDPVTGFNYGEYRGEIKVTPWPDGMYCLHYIILESTRTKVLGTHNSEYVYMQAGDDGCSMVVAEEDAASAIFTDSFDTSSLKPDWHIVGGTWNAVSGRVSQTDSVAIGYTKKLALPAIAGDYVIKAKVRVDQSSANAVYVGLGCNTQASNGVGYGIVFWTPGTLRFVNNGASADTFIKYNWNVGQWYWLKLKSSGNLAAKIWQVTEPEPVEWMGTQSGWTNHPGGSPCLYGGVAPAMGSFDCVSIVPVEASPLIVDGMMVEWNPDGQCVDLTWTPVPAAGYTVERSIDNGANWIGIWSGYETKWSDTATPDGATYQYRIVSVNDAGRVIGPVGVLKLP